MNSPFAAHWTLDPAVSFLNHGSFGACPAPVLHTQMLLREELEREPVDFLAATLPQRLDQTREALARFLGADPADLVFVPNATAGVNAVLRSLIFEPEDELLLTTHTYAACRKTLEFVAARTGAHLVVVSLPFPVQSAEQIQSAVLAAVTPRTRLALLDHVTSPTALVLPIADLVRELRAHGVETLVDGAHAPGMVRLDLEQLGAAYYTGNAHKWLCAPKGAAFLHARRDCQHDLHPNVISHGYRSGFHAEFDWTGTCDPTPWLCIPAALRFMETLLPGGWPEVMAHNHSLVLQARALLLAALEVAAPCPPEMIGSMASILLPAAKAHAPGAGLDAKGLHDWFRERGIETWIHSEPRPVVRISAQLYNYAQQFERLAQLLRQCLYGD